MRIKHPVKSVAVATLLIFSFSAYCFLNVESQKQDATHAELITIPVQESNVPSLPDVQIFYYVIDQIKGGLISGK